MQKPNAPDAAHLSTKHKIPAPRRGYIVRRQLFATLARWCAFDVTYVKAAAGMGKTTLVSSFIRENHLRDVSWFSLDADDDDLLAFWSGLADAVSVLPGVHTEKMAGLLDAPSASVRANALASKMREVLDGVPCSLLVLDDLHVLQEEEVLHSLEIFLSDLPENLHLFLISREAPAFYTGTLSMEGRLLFLDSEALRISGEEGIRFLRDTLGMDADKDRAERLAARAEGWIGGLQLLAAADGMGAASPRTGKTLAAEYLTREIFATLPPEEQRFLTVTSILPYFDRGLCTALLGEGDHVRMAERLMAKNLFLVCVDEETGTYRYHSILGEYLKQRFAELPQDEQANLHRKAAMIFCERTERLAALPHLLAAGEFAQAGKLLSAMGDRAESWHYLNRLPQDVVQADANLAVQSLVYNLLLRPDQERAKQAFHALKLSGASNPFLQAWGQVGIYVGERVDFSHLPKPVMPEQIENDELNPVVQAMVYVGNASLFLEQEDYENSARFADRAYEICGGKNPFIDFYLLSARAQLAEETGELNESLRVFGEMADAVKRSPAVGLLDVFHAVGRTGVYLKRMERAPAAAALEEAARGLKRYPAFPFLMTFGYTYNRVEYDLIFGSMDVALEGLEKLLAWSNRSMRTILVCDRLLLPPLAQNRLPDAWAERFLNEYRGQQKQASLTAQLIAARLLWRRGERDAAMQMVEQVLAFSRAHQNRLTLIAAGLLKAVMLLQTSGENRVVRNLLLEAVHYAWENHVLLPFFVERSALAEAFGALPTDDMAEGERTFLQEVRTLCAASPPGEELLSEREREVLRELACGLTNPQIAERLCISLATVKTHLLNIYGKLEVSTRVQAVEEARKRKMLF